ncbi:uncharacterized protein LOC116851922 [Odontomachus brunneus]|uniref:uncharacterized protein LOC116851922 n=1 Tax=Odontomachus brunneus TaxID=486640 RepID=UPI0013F1D39B|nr:uncharacterized protein LOC116851922 [Odontomachus brunneus]
MEDSTLLQYFAPQTPDYYDTFFNPNICHVCKTTSDTLMPCNRCNMIFYCDTEHRQFDEPYHTQICGIITTLSTEAPQRDVRQLNMNEWLEAKKIYYWLVMKTLPRLLKPHEIQMFQFARSCLICHQETNLYTCSSCYSVNYCTEHADSYIRTHYQSSTCKQLLLCLNLDIQQTMLSNVTTSLKLHTINSKSLLTNMETFINQYVNLNQVWGFKEYYYSDYVSAPLTLFYGMMHAKLLDFLEVQSPVCVIHIIAANNLDKEYLPAWELLLHLNPDLEELTVVLIGIELCTEHWSIDLCSDFK